MIVTQARRLNQVPWSIQRNQKAFATPARTQPVLSYAAEKLSNSVFGVGPSAKKHCSPTSFFGRSTEEQEPSEREVDRSLKSRGCQQSLERPTNSFGFRKEGLLPDCPGLGSCESNLFESDD